MRRRLTLVPLVLLLAAGGCREPKISAYRVPKEPVEEPATTPADMAASTVPTADGTDLTWTAPAAWQAKTAGAMRKASYTVPGPVARRRTSPSPRSRATSAASWPTSTAGAARSSCRRSRPARSPAP